MQRLVCRRKGANEDLENLKKMFLIKAPLRASISSEPQLPSRKWEGCPDPSEGGGWGSCPEAPMFQLNQVNVQALLQTVPGLCRIPASRADQDPPCRGRLCREALGLCAGGAGGPLGLLS